MTRVSLRNETPDNAPDCAGPACLNPIVAAATGRPARFCSAACRTRAHRQRPAVAPAHAEVAMGSASSRGRPEDRGWLAHLDRGDRTVIVAIGLRRPAADRLAAQINDLLAEPTGPNP